MGSELQIIHQVVVIALQFVRIQFFPEKIFHIILIPLESGNNVGHFRFIDPDGNLHDAGFRIVAGIQLGDLCIIGFHQFADFIKGILIAVHFQVGN